MSETVSTGWSDCLGEAAWLRFPLEHNLHYTSPLPVQQAVVPTVARALLSGIPMDVSLTAPTGSGKTLCYLLPALRLITHDKRGVDNTALRAVILVPTKALGQQVFREVQRLTRNTSITAASLCDDVETVKEESRELVRYATVLRAANGPTAGDAQAGLLNGESWDEGAGDADDEVVATEETDGWLPSRGRPVSFSKVDLVVATPQRLLRHLDGATPGFSLASLRLLVIDEADQVLAGNFASFVSKVMDRFDSEQDQLRAAEAHSLHSTHAAAPSTVDVRLLSSTCTAAVLHKILCSATLSSRIGRISEVRLRNCVYYALDSHGNDVEGGNTGSLTTTAGRGFLKTTFALPPTLQEHIVFVEDAYRHAALLKLVVRLVESIQRQHARRQRQRTREKNSGDDESDTDSDADTAANKSAGGTQAVMSSSSDYPAADEDAGTGILVFCSSAEEARVMGHLLTAAGVKGVVEFTTLATESERRRALLGPMRGDGAGEAVDSLLPPSQSSARRGRRTASFSPMCVVASDALMRGIDIPNVGHVIMYHPPTSISQYVHRAGRTARAMRPGHLHLLLSKTGRSGTQQDGEMALFKVLSEQLTRTLPVKHERHFFFFDAAPRGKPKAVAAPVAAPTPPAAEELDKVGEVAVPAEAGVVAETAADAVATGTSSDAHNEVEAAPAVASVAEADSVSVAAEVREGSAEWWVKEADRYLEQSQHHLQRMWASALQTALRDSKGAKLAGAQAVGHAHTSPGDKGAEGVGRDGAKGDSTSAPTSHDGGMRGRGRGGPSRRFPAPRQQSGQHVSPQQHRHTQSKQGGRQKRGRSM